MEKKFVRIEYDREADAVYIYLKEKIEKGEVKKTVSLNKQINLDYDEKDKIVGIEILDAGNKTALNIASEKALAKSI